LAIYNEIQTGRLNRFLQKYLGIKGGPPAPQLQADIGTTLNLFSGVENRNLEGWNRYGLNVNVPATAAQTNGVRLRNPPASGVIAVVELIIVTNNSAGTDSYLIDYGFIAQGFTGVDYGTSQNANAPSLDPRQSGRPALVCTSGTPGAIAGNAVLMEAVLGANQNFSFIGTEDQQIAVPPSADIAFRNSVVNVTSIVSWIWRERPLEDSEKT